MTKVTVKTLRLKNSQSNDIPKFPKLKPKDYDPHLVRWMQKASFTLEEAAYLVHGVTPDNPTTKISTQGTDDPSQTYYWLNKEYKTHKRISFVDENGRCSLGDVFRYLWEAPRRNFNLKAWNVYFEVTNGDFSGAVDKKISDIRYKEAADLIWEQDSDLTKEKVIETLLKLHKLVRDDDGLPLFLVTSPSPLNELLKRQAARKRGRPQKGDKTAGLAQEEQVIKKIRDSIKK